MFVVEFLNSSLLEVSTLAFHLMGTGKRPGLEGNHALIPCMYTAGQWDEKLSEVRQNPPLSCILLSAWLELTQTLFWDHETRPCQDSKQGSVFLTLEEWNTKRTSRSENFSRSSSISCRR